MSLDGITNVGAGELSTDKGYKWNTQDYVRQPELVPLYTVGTWGMLVSRSYFLVLADKFDKGKNVK